MLLRPWGHLKLDAEKSSPPWNLLSLTLTIIDTLQKTTAHLFVWILHIDTYYYYHLVIFNIAMENHHFYTKTMFKMVAYYPMIFPLLPLWIPVIPVVTGVKPLKNHHWSPHIFLWSPHDNKLGYLCPISLLSAQLKSLCARAARSASAKSFAKQGWRRRQGVYHTKKLVISWNI